MTDSSSVPETTAAPKPGRLLSLDAFRGMTIAAMILVNNPGTWSHVYPPLLHAKWHGCTFTDLVFPFFLFIVGVAIVFALGRRKEAGVSASAVLGKVLYRAAMLVLLGLFLAFYMKWEFDTLRIPGVLQRIGICYLLASLFFWFLPKSILPWLIGLLTLGYWALLTVVPVPGIPEPSIHEPLPNLASYVDRLLLTGHMWQDGWDPEGLLSTIPALATCLCGVLAGLVLRDPARSPDDKTRGLLLRGAALFAIGMAWSWFFPLNKALWTSSYALATAGMAAMALGLCHHAFDVKGHRRWATPFAIYGVNAILVFVGSGILARSLRAIPIHEANGNETHLRSWLYTHSFEAWIADPKLASLAWAVSWVLGWFVVLAILWRKRIVLKL
jgi:predicted acyltransferase